MTGDIANGTHTARVPIENIGLQIFTVRDLIAPEVLDLEGTFELLHDAGYRGVELAGDYYGWSPGAVRHLAESNGLTVWGNHFGPRTMVKNSWYDANERSRIFDEAHQLGLCQVGTGHSYVAPLTVDGYKEMAAAFNSWGEEAQENGFEYFYFHNHDHEFTLVNGRPLFDVLLAETDPRYVRFEVDLGWLMASGQSATEYLRAYQDRLPLLHVKDYRYEEGGARTVKAGTVAAGRKFNFTDLGKGSVDWVAVLSVLRDPRAHRFIVEQDDAPFSTERAARSERQLNPAGSANTAWRGRRFLAELELEV